MPRKRTKHWHRKAMAGRAIVLSAFERAQTRVNVATSAQEVAGEVTDTARSTLTSWAPQNLTHYGARILLLETKRNAIGQSKPVYPTPFYYSHGRKSSLAPRER